MSSGCISKCIFLLSWCFSGTLTWVCRAKHWPSALWPRSCCITRPACASTTLWIAPTQTLPLNLFYDIFVFTMTQTLSGAGAACFCVKICHLDIVGWTVHIEYGGMHIFLLLFNDLIAAMTEFRHVIPHVLIVLDCSFTFVVYNNEVCRLQFANEIHSTKV